MTRYPAIPRDQNRVPVLSGVSTVDGITPVPVEVNPATGALLVSASAGLVTAAYDYIGVTYPDGVTEVYVFKSGGSGGTTKATITVVYSDSTKANISSVTRV